MQNILCFVSTNREQIEGAIREALASSQEGLRYSELVRYIKEKHRTFKQTQDKGSDVFEELFG